MKIFVETAGVENRKAFPALNGHGKRNLIISLSLHHVMMQDEPVLVFQNASFLETRFNRHACLAFTDPVSMGFENEAYFFLMGNYFAFEHTARDPVNLADSVLAITFGFKLQKSLGEGVGDQSGHQSLLGAIGRTHRFCQPAERILRFSLGSITSGR